MKRLISATLTIMVLFCTLTYTALAKDTETEITYYADGSYDVTTIESDSYLRAVSGQITKSKKTVHQDNNGNILWMAKITATFTYNGTSATCTNVTKAHHIYNDSWKLTASSASKSGATATGAFTLKHYVLGVPTKTINKTLTLTCDKNGNVR